MQQFGHTGSEIANLARFINVIDNLFCRLREVFVQILRSFRLALLRQSGFTADIGRSEQPFYAFFLVF